MTLASALVPEEPTAESAKPDRRILWLVVGHVVLGLLAAFSVGKPHSGSAVWEHVLIWGILFSHTTLTGILVGLGLNSMGQRFLSFVGEAGYLPLFLWLMGPSPREDILSLVVLLVVPTVPLLIMRLCGFSIEPTATSGAVAGHAQFSIFQLFIITTIFAILLPLAMRWRTHDPDSGSVFCVQCTTTTVGMLQVWIILATNRPFVAVGITALASFAVYLIFPLLVDPAAPASLAIGISTAPMVVALTLLIVRSFGYRLVTRPSLHQRATPTIGVESSITRAAD